MPCQDSHFQDFSLGVSPIDVTHWRDLPSRSVARSSGHQAKVLVLHASLLPSLLLGRPRLGGIRCHATRRFPRRLADFRCHATRRFAMLGGFPMRSPDARAHAHSAASWSPTLGSLRSRAPGDSFALLPGASEILKTQGPRPRAVSAPAPPSHGGAGMGNGPAAAFIRPSMVTLSRVQQNAG